MSTAPAAMIIRQRSAGRNQKGTGSGPVSTSVLPVMWTIQPFVVFRVAGESASNRICQGSCACVHYVFARQIPDVPLSIPQSKKRCKNESLMKELIEQIAKALVDNPEQVSV